MDVEGIARAIAAAPRQGLDALAKEVWRLFGADMLSEAEASELCEAIAARRAPPPAPPPPWRPTGSRPRSSASVERRRRWAGSGWLPPQLHARFTPAEISVLSVVASEVMRTGSCILSIATIAGMAGTGRTLVKRAIGAARRLGVLHVEARPVTAWRNATNVLTVVSPEWRIWLARRARGVGSRPGPDTRTSLFPTSSSTSPAESNRAFRLGDGGKRGIPSRTPRAAPTRAVEANRAAVPYIGARQP